MSSPDDSEDEDTQYEEGPFIEDEDIEGCIEVPNEDAIGYFSSHSRDEKGFLRQLRESSLLHAAYDKNIETYEQPWDFHVLAICITIGYTGVANFPAEVAQFGGGAYFIPCHLAFFHVPACMF